MNRRLLAGVFGTIIVVAMIVAAVGTASEAGQAQVSRPNRDYSADVRSAEFADDVRSDDAALAGLRHRLVNWCVGPFVVHDGRVTFEASTLLAPTEDKRIGNGYC